MRKRTRLADDIEQGLTEVLEDQRGKRKLKKTKAIPKPSKKEQAQQLEWILTRCEICSKRYIEAEQLIFELAPFWKRIFAKKKIMDFLYSRGKYEF